MNSFFPEKLLGEIFWDQPLLPTDQSGVVQYSHIINGEAFPPATQSAFVQYRDLPRRNNPLNGSNSESTSKRMLAFLRKSCPLERNNVEENERDRSFRHMINERMRRKRQRQCCLALHSILPHGTKADTNSVIQTAAKEIVRLQRCREELQRKNCEAEANVEDVFVRKHDGGSKIAYLRVANPNKCGIDSMVERLKWLKEEGVDSRSIKSSFSSKKLFAVLEIESGEGYKFGGEKLCEFFDNVVGKEGMKLMGRFIGKLEEKAKDNRFRILL